MKFLLAVSLVVMAWMAPGSLLGEPAEPLGLRQLYVLSTSVVTGRVTEVVKLRPEKDFSDRRVTLEVASVLKGSLVGPKVSIRAGSADLCPADAFYAQGQSYLVFLSVNEKGEYWTTGLSYGALPLPEGGEAVYRELLNALKPVLEIPQEEARRAAVAGWLVQGTRTPLTRAAALRELEYLGYWGSFQPWSDLDEPADQDGEDEEIYAVRYWKYLTLPQVTELAELLRRLQPNNGVFCSQTAAMMRIVAKRLGTPAILAAARRYVSDSEAADSDESGGTSDPQDRRNGALRAFFVAFDGRSK